MKKTIFAFFGVVMLSIGITFIPVQSFATSTTTSSSTQALLDQVSALMKQMKSLNDQMSEIKTQQKVINKEFNGVIKDLKKQLNPGDKNDDVAIIQALLATDSTIYPEGLVTGHFGNLTKEAIKKFQRKHGILVIGRVGPQTLKKLNELLREHPVQFENASSTQLNSTSSQGSSWNKDQDDDGKKSRDKRDDNDKNKRKLCAIVPPGHLIAPGWLKKNGARPIILPCQNIPPGIWPKISPMPSATPGVTPTPSVSATPTPTPSQSPTPTPSATPTPTVTPTPTPSATPTPTPTVTPSPTPTPSPTVNPTPTPTVTPTPTPTAIPTVSPTPTP